MGNKPEFGKLIYAFIIKPLPVVWLQLPHPQRYEDGSQVIILKIWSRLIFNATIFVLGPIFSEIQAKNQIGGLGFTLGENASGAGWRSCVLSLRRTL